MNPRHPIYIVSKGRADSRLTMKGLDYMQVPYHVIIEQQEFDDYAAVIDPGKLLVLDVGYQVNYETLDELGLSKSTGPGPARNFAWDHAIKSGASWHWVMDDNIRYFCRHQNNKIIKVMDGTILCCMEDWADRYDNVAMVGPQYEFFLPRREKHKPLILNTRIYSCNLIRNDLPFRWRCRYNEDTDLSLRLLKAGWCTAQFNAFLQKKMPTQTIGGGCTKDFYIPEGTLPKSQMLAAVHPDVARIVWKYGRWHHQVDYRPFKGNRLRLKTGLRIPEGVNDYGMQIRSVS